MHHVKQCVKTPLAIVRQVYMSERSAGFWLSHDHSCILDNNEKLLVLQETWHDYFMETGKILEMQEDT